jgi:hypothetical protein
VTTDTASGDNSELEPAGETAPDARGLTAEDLTTHRAFAQRLLDGQADLTEEERSRLWAQHEGGLRRLQAHLVGLRESQLAALQAKLKSRTKSAADADAAFAEARAELERLHAEQKERLVRTLQDEFAALLARLQLEKAKQLVDIATNHARLQEKLTAELAQSSLEGPATDVDPVLAQHTDAVERLHRAQEQAKAQSEQKLQRRLQQRKTKGPLPPAKLPAAGGSAPPASPEQAAAAAAARVAANATPTASDAAAAGSGSASAARVRWGLATKSALHEKEVSQQVWGSMVDNAKEVARLRRELQKAQTKERADAISKLINELSSALELSSADKDKVISNLKASARS